MPNLREISSIVFYVEMMLSILYINRYVSKKGSCQTSKNRQEPFEPSTRSGRGRSSYHLCRAIRSCFMTVTASAHRQTRISRQHQVCKRRLPAERHHFTEQKSDEASLSYRYPLVKQRIHARAAEYDRFRRIGKPVCRLLRPFPRGKSQFDLFRIQRRIRVKSAVPLRKMDVCSHCLPKASAVHSRPFRPYTAPPVCDTIPPRPCRRSGRHTWPVAFDRDAAFLFMHIPCKYLRGLSHEQYGHRSLSRQHCSAHALPFAPLCLPHRAHRETVQKTL